MSMRDARNRAKAERQFYKREELRRKKLNQIEKATPSTLTEREFNDRWDAFRKKLAKET